MYIRKRSSSRRAVSDLLVMAIIFLLVVSVVMPLFIFIQGSASQHRSTTALRKSLELQKQQEKVFVTAGGREEAELRAILENASPISVRIMRLYVINTSSQQPMNMMDLSLVIQIGQKVDVPVNMDYPTINFDIKVVTERGNLFARSDVVPPPPSPLGECGDIWDYLGPGSIIYAEFSYETSDLEQDVPYWTIESGAKNVVWKATMVNHGTQNITLDASSALVVIGEGASNKITYFIVGSGSSSGDLIPYNSGRVILLPKHPEGDRCAGGAPTPVMFGSRNEDTGSPSGDANAPTVQGPYAVFIVMVGTDEDGNRISQNIPFAGLYVE